MVGRRDLAELHEATRAPGQHLAGLALRKLVERVFRHAAGRLDVAGAHLDDAAAMGRTTHDAIAHAQAHP